ncbi:hypothetical protein RJ639_026023 [Escallonia herrerae]|uniref:RNase H type-1 domain-containing protein n=1 Tax=Escallonia herrerae TaxID=1293975 RepID=A0AA88UX34_9ASTE|nr:hypothetical protein RJ639_026023 [Escallonia herrerae]
MNCLFRVYSTAVLSRAGSFGARVSVFSFFTPLWSRSYEHADVKAVNLEFLFTRFRVQCYSTRRGTGSKGSGSKSRAKKQPDPEPEMADEKNAFFVVRKGDVVGVYKNFNECQAQVGTSICDPPVSVYKGYAMPNDTEDYLLSCGLKNAVYSIRAGDIREGLFGPLVPCRVQPPPFAKVETSSKDLSKKRSQEMLGSEAGGFALEVSVFLSLVELILIWILFGNVHFAGTPRIEFHIKSFVAEACQVRLSCRDSSFISWCITTPSLCYYLLIWMMKMLLLLKPVSLENLMYIVQRSCVLKFDGASKGNPGQAGAGAVLRADDGNLICRLREGLGIATNNVAEYRAIILGLRYALEKGFTSIRVLGDSKLVCMQVQGLWKVKNQNISPWYEEAKKLKDRFLYFQITHVLRDLNSEADTQANLAVDLADGQVQEEVVK